MLKIKALVFLTTFSCFALPIHGQSGDNTSREDHYASSVVTSIYKSAEEFAFCIGTNQFATEVAKAGGNPEWIVLESATKNLRTAFKPALVRAGHITDVEFETAVKLREAGLMMFLRSGNQNRVAEAMHSCMNKFSQLKSRLGIK